MVLVSSEIQSKVHCCLLENKNKSRNKNLHSKKIQGVKTRWWRETFHIWRCKGHGLLFFLLFFFLNLHTVLLEDSLSWAPLSLAYCSPGGAKVKLPRAVPLTEQRGAPPTPSRRREESLLLFFNCLLVSLFGQLNDVRTLNDGERGQTGKGGTGTVSLRGRSFQSERSAPARCLTGHWGRALPCSCPADG